MGEALLRRKLLIADQAVGPEIHHFDCELVGAYAGGGAEFHRERLLPQNSQRPAVEPDLGDLAHVAEIERPLVRGAQIDTRGVARGAGVVADAGVRVFAPGKQLVERGLRWSAPTRRESDGPRTSDRHGRGR